MDTAENFTNIATPFKSDKIIQDLLILLHWANDSPKNTRKYADIRFLIVSILKSYFSRKLITIKKIPLVKNGHFQSKIKYESLKKY